MATLLERETLQAQLHAQWDQATAGSGRLVCVEGEAGIGKTSLLRAFAGSLAGSARVFWGGCEALRTPRPLGALDDIAGQSGGELQALLSRGADRHRVFVAFMDLLAERPTLVVLEDLHWADEATLDLLRYVGRRVMRTRSLLVASFRSDELVPAHPLRTVLGDLATTGVTRLVPAPLTLAAVHTLGLGHAVDLAELHRVTGGNPFFVTEVLAAGGQGMPCTVQDAVLARAARLSASARAVLDAAAVAGPRVEPWLLQALTAAESTAIDECLATGVLRAEDGAYVFRHELARQAERSLRVDRLETENLHLRGLIDMRPGLSVRSQPAQVLYEASDPYTRKVIIDRGTTEGVGLGSPVITEAGVLGQVTRAYPYSSEVTLLTDKDAAIPVLNARSQTRSAAFGGLGGLELRFIASNADIQVGDRLLTSGVDGVYPSGVPVATVALIDRKADSGFARIMLTPAVKSDGVRHVLVL